MVYRMTINRTPGQYNVPAIKKAVHNRLSRLWRDATKVFVNTLIESMYDNYAKVDTGMSKASVLPLAAQVRRKSALAATIQGKGPKRFGGQNIGALYKPPGLERSIARGEELGRKAFILSFGDLNNPTFVLDFQIVVLQHQIHEAHWDSLNKALEAMKRWIADNKFKSQYVDTNILATWALTGVVKA